MPPSGAFAVADIGEHGILGFAQRACLDHAGAAPEFARPAGIAAYLEFIGEDRRQPLLSFYGLGLQAGAEAGGGDVAARPIVKKVLSTWL